MSLTPELRPPIVFDETEPVQQPALVHATFVVPLPSPPSPSVFERLRAGRRLPAVVLSGVLTVGAAGVAGAMAENAPTSRPAATQASDPQLAQLLNPSLPPAQPKPNSIKLPHHPRHQRSANPPEVVTSTSPTPEPTHKSTARKSSKSSQATQQPHALREKLSNPLKIVDLSWTDCIKDKHGNPTNQLNNGLLKNVEANYAIIGINSGRPTNLHPENDSRRATNTDECLPELLVWASRSHIDRVELYANAANPGVSHPRAYGKLVMTAALKNFLAAAKEAHAIDKDVPTNLRAYHELWLDVETMNSWLGTKLENEQVLEGMADVVQKAGLRRGIYSVNSIPIPPHYSMFHHIVGSIPPHSNLIGLDSWLAQGNGVEGAAQACGFPPLTPGSHVIITQYVYRGIDRNLACRSLLLARK